MLFSLLQPPVYVFTKTLPLLIRCDIRSIFMQCKAGLNSEFSFF